MRLRPVLSEQETRDYEASLLKKGKSQQQLMDHVARGMARRFAREWKGRGGFDRCLFLVGPGNNGGDALSLLRHVLEENLLEGVDFERSLRIVAWPSDRLSDLRRFQEAALLKEWQGNLLTWPRSSREAQQILESHRDLSWIIIDGLFGVGYRACAAPKEVSVFLKALEDLLGRRKCFVGAVDLPSGLMESGERAREFSFLRADTCWCAGGPKWGQLEGVGPTQSGRLEIVGLESQPSTSYGGYTHLREALARRKESRAWWWPARWRTLMDVLREPANWNLPQPTDHKTRRGRVGIVGGSLGRGGAPRLVAEAALRGGMGYARVVDSEPLLQEAQSVGEWLVENPPKGRAAWKKWMNSQDVLVFGCGLPAGGVPQGEESRWREFFEVFQESLLASKTLRGAVIDGGGLVTFLRMWKALAGSENRVPLVLTPHPKEAQDLLRADGVKSFPTSRRELGQLLSERLSAHGIQGALLLKGAYPWVFPLGDASEKNKSFAVDLCHPALATAGSGDVFSGTIAAVLERVPTLESSDRGVLSLLIALTAQRQALRSVRGYPLASELGVKMGQALELFWSTLWSLRKDGVSDTQRQG